MGRVTELSCQSASDSTSQTVRPDLKKKFDLTVTGSRYARYAASSHQSSIHDRPFPDISSTRATSRSWGRVAGGGVSGSGGAGVGVAGRREWRQSATIGTGPAIPSLTCTCRASLHLQGRTVPNTKLHNKHLHASTSAALFHKVLSKLTALG
jgi:hypothetical protein